MAEFVSQYFFFVIIPNSKRVIQKNVPLFDWFLAPFLPHVRMLHFIVKIDSIIRSFCLCHACKMFYLIWGKEMQPKLYKSDTKLGSGVRDLEQNKHQLLHRIQSVWTSLSYYNLMMCLVHPHYHVTFFISQKNMAFVM